MKTNTRRTVGEIISKKKGRTWYDHRVGANGNLEYIGRTAIQPDNNDSKAHTSKCRPNGYNVARNQFVSHFSDLFDWKDYRGEIIIGIGE
jgi:hypothetical protein